MSIVSAISDSMLSTASDSTTVTSQTASQTPSDTTATPAVIVSISSAATSATNAPSKTISADPLSVEHALASISGLNGAYSIYMNASNPSAKAAAWEAYQERAKVYSGGGLGIPITSTINAISPTNTDSSAGSPSTDSTSSATSETAGQAIRIGNFNFTDGGSTYQVTTNADGDVIGTKDGLPWLTLQLLTGNQIQAPNAETANAQVALSSLTSTQSSKVDVLA